MKIAESGTVDISVNAYISGLSQDTSYHYRLVAYNAFGTNNGDDKSFNTTTTILYVQVKANGQDGHITVTPSDPVSIEISLNPGEKAGQNADWWIAVNTSFASPIDWYSYVYPAGWMPGINLCVQAPLFDISQFEILNTILPLGNYIFYFAVDDPDGAAIGPWWGLDWVEVTVQ